jgi:uncharacterized protein
MSQDIAAAPPASVTNAGEPPRRLLASPLHTAILVLVVMVVSLYGSTSVSAGIARSGRIRTYAFTIVYELVLLAWVWFGIHRRGGRIRDLIGGRWQTPEDFLLDLAIAGGFWIVALGVLAGLSFALGLVGEAQTDAARKTLFALAPSTRGEIALFIALSCVAGFIEEVVFRGYLHRQFAALTAGSAVIGIVSSGIVFGLSHGYEGPKRMLVIAVYGMLFGILAQWRKSLRPGMMAHAWHDAVSGIVLRLMK